MAYILAATDFSPVSDNAVDFAADLAASVHAELILVHSFAFPMLVSDLPMPASLIDDTREDAETHLSALHNRLAVRLPDLPISRLVNFGTLVDTINDYIAKHGHPDFVVMGNSNTSEDSAWFFSTLREAVHDLHGTILAVPPDVSFRPVRKICFATDIEQPENGNALAKLSHAVVRFGAELHVLNVQEDVFNRDNIPEPGERTKQLLADAMPHYHFRYEADVDVTIRTFCDNYGIDWLALIPGSYSFVAGIFHRSHTKVMASTLHLPLLLLNEEQA